MGARLTTVATFDLAANAHIAKNLLDAAGIPAVVADEQVVAMDFLLANAVGGIKVQVRAEDAGRAAEVLNARLGDRAGVVPDTLDEDELTRQALAAPRESDEPDDEEPPADDEPVADPSDAVSERDEYAFRMFRSAVFGLFFFPLAFYAFYLFLNALFAPGELSATGRQRLFVGGMILFASWWWVYFLLSAGLLFHALP